MLSPSTEAFDLGRKFEDYRSLDSLKEYVLIAQDRISAMRYRKVDDEWRLYFCGPGDTLSLESVVFRTPIEAIYEGLRFPAEPDSEPLNARIRSSGAEPT